MFSPPGGGNLPVNLLTAPWTFIDVEPVLSVSVLHGGKVIGFSLFLRNLSKDTREGPFLTLPVP